MGQKINWIICLIIGINMIIFSCEKIQELNVKTSYVYINNSNYDINIKVFNKKDRSFVDELIILKNDSASLVFFGDGIPVSPFFYDSNIDSIGDSISVIFNNEKFISFTKESQNTLLDSKNYNLIFFNESEYQYQYKFSNLDYNNAVPITK